MWYAAIAMATVTTVADLGLRTAGHVELLPPGAGEVSRSSGGVSADLGRIRVLVLLVTMVAMVVDGAYGWWRGVGTWEITRILLTVAYAVEALLTIRIVYLDSLGVVQLSGMKLLSFPAVRLALAVPALLVLKVLSPRVLSALPGHLVVRPVPCRAGCAPSPGRAPVCCGPFPSRLSLRTCSLARYTMAEPIANWVRLSLPVLVIAGIAPAAAVTTYVALRAIYGAARTTINKWPA